MDKLIVVTRRYETNINTLAEIKDNFEQLFYCYFAGTLCLSTRDLTSDERVTIDIKPIEAISDSIEKEIMYYASKMYEKVKGSSCSFYEQSVQNISKYEGEIK